MTDLRNNAAECRPEHIACRGLIREGAVETERCCEILTQQIENPCRDTSFKTSLSIPNSHPGYRKRSPEPPLAVCLEWRQAVNSYSEQGWSINPIG